MGFFKDSKTIDRLNRMIDNAIDGKPIEQGFDESKVSALETKLSSFLAMNSTTKNRLAEEKAKINELISDISHQTKTPLANILLYTQLLGECDLPQKERSYLESLIQQAEKLNFLIASLVKASRLESGIISVSPVQTEISKLIETVVGQAKQNAERKSISLKVGSCDASACFDLKWTSEALYNILDNAIKYTPENGSVAVSVTSYQLFCRIDVTDNGIGISEDEQARIFSRFYRSPSVSGDEGVGIGLYIAREIASLQGGYIKLRSKPNEGSTFSIFLPVEG